MCEPAVWRSEIPNSASDLQFRKNSTAGFSQVIHIAEYFSFNRINFHGKDDYPKIGSSSTPSWKRRNRSKPRPHTVARWRPNQHFLIPTSTWAACCATPAGLTTLWKRTVFAVALEDLDQSREALSIYGRCITLSASSGRQMRRGSSCGQRPSRTNFSAGLACRTLRCGNSRDSRGGFPRQGSLNGASERGRGMTDLVSFSPAYSGIHGDICLARERPSGRSAQYQCTDDGTGLSRSRRQQPLLPGSPRPSSTMS